MPFLSANTGATDVQTTARYQNHPGNATSRAKIGPHVLSALAGLSLCMGLLFAGRGVALGAGLAVASQEPAAQSQQGVTRQLYLLPADNSSVQLQTHLAKLDVAYHSDGSASAIMDAAYRIKNDTDASISQPLVLYAGVGSALPQGVSMTANGVPLTLGTTADGALTAQVDVPADSQMLIRLSYRVTVADSPIITIRYAPSVLRKWLGPTSTRIEYSLPDAIARESWTRVSPDSWSYAAADLGYTAIKWLYDSVVPDDEFVVQFVEPVLWSRVQAAEAASASGGSATAYLTRGDLYRGLAETASVDEVVRERFAAQAVAAYADGIAQGASASPAELAQLHMGLATLYRDRAANPNRETVAHAALMVDETTAALSLLDAGDARRAELQQWLADGLRTLFTDARARGDWQRVSQVVDQMAALPPGSVDPNLIEEGRQIVLVQQALQLLQRGEHEAAAALAGSEITAESAAAPAELHPLFAAWHITATAEPDTMHVEIEGIPEPGREVEAQGKLESLSLAWQAELLRAPAGEGLLVSGVQSDARTGALRLRLQAPATSFGKTWATYVPAGADFAFLHSALAQLSPQLDESTRFFQREVQRSQPMDLREAGDRWAAKAADIERQAAELHAQAGSEDAKAQLLAEMKAANYRNTAEAWRNLARDSWLRFQFQSGDQTDENAPTQSRAWYATADSAPVVFTMQSQSLDLSLAAGMAMAAAAFLAALAGLLWWLM